MRETSSESNPHWATRPTAVLAAFALLSFLYFGLRLLIDPGRQYIGVFDDPQIPIWSFAWWLHSITHFDNPFVTHAVWAPTGVNLAWANTTPALAIVLAPLTAIAGPVAAYNVAVILMPALSAWTAYLLCRHLVGQFWPALVGGYLFGFSSYVLGHVIGQPQLTGVFALPLIALVLVRHLEGTLGRAKLTIWLGLLVALQLAMSMELAFTATISLALSLILGFALAPAFRRRLVSMLVPLAGAYAIGAVLTAPLLYYALSAPRISGFQPPGAYIGDLLNFVIPTHLVAFGAGWANSITHHFPGNYSEQGTFVGLPLLAIVVLYARRCWSSARGRFLLVCLALAAFISLGQKLTVYGHGLFPLPTPLGHDTLTVPGVGTKHVPLFDNVLPVRFALYASLVLAVIVALWMASPHRNRLWSRLLPALGVLLLIPNPSAGVWATTFSIPPFFTDSVYRNCLASNEIVLPQPVGPGGQAMLWQVADKFRFRMAGGRLQTSPPSVFLHPSGIAQISVGYPPVANQTKLLREYFKAKDVTAVIVDKRQSSTWTPALDRIAKPQDVGGILLYHVAGTAPARCGVTH